MKKTVLLFVAMLCGCGGGIVVTDTSGVDLEPPGCEMQRQMRWAVQEYEWAYGRISQSDMACVDDYIYAILPRDQWPYEYNIIGMHQGRKIYILDRERDTYRETRVQVEQTMRHEAFHHILMCTGQSGSSDHTNRLFADGHVAYPVTDKPHIVCEDSGPIFYCDTETGSVRCWGNYHGLDE